MASQTASSVRPAVVKVMVITSLRPIASGQCQRIRPALIVITKVAILITSSGGGSRRERPRPQLVSGPLLVAITKKPRPRPPLLRICVGAFVTRA